MSTPSGQTYTATRPRGLASWNPRLKTLALLSQIYGVLEEYESLLPLTARQLFYRLVGAHGYPKEERAYARLLETLNRARRSGRIPFHAIRADGITVDSPVCYCGVADFWGAVRDTARGYRCDRLANQPVAIEVWCEASGMVPQLSRTAGPYGIAVYSSGGFDSTTVKYEAAQRMVNEDRPTVVLHIGDYDPSGCSILDSAAEDVETFVCDLEGEHDPVFERVAVTPEQVESYALPTAPVKSTDRRGNWQGGTVQAEALDPNQLRDELQTAIDTWIDGEVYAETLETEAEERATLLERVEAVAIK